MLSLAYGCGMRADEVVRLKVGDIDSAQEITRIFQAKGCKDRDVVLPAGVLGLLRDGLKAALPLVQPETMVNSHASACY
ncbi:tyrosine-type recombinase/integrase [Meridianimarinicoccus aquatilis]|uniref:tyrosine-type recombinase/integrase n=1 Tax=Meridianimarinicoccus aquatilis TaxID=2552766 RepID=UPI001FB5AB1E|nr:tyrosine-type recombinase/integrase [Fluviibacterium aquatile]